MYAELYCNDAEVGIKSLTITKLKKDVYLMQALENEFVHGTEKAIPMLQKEVDEMKQLSEESLNKDKLTSYAEHLETMKNLAVPVPGAVANGFDEGYAVSTFKAIERFAEYSFNRSHSAAYSMISYWNAYMKTHYPVEFMASLLSVEGDDEEKTLRNIQECRRLNIPILPPDINKSKLEYSIEETPIFDEKGNQMLNNDGQLQTTKAIRFGLLSIKGVGPKVIDEIRRRPPTKEEVIFELGERKENIDELAKELEEKDILDGTPTTPGLTRNYRHLAQNQMEEQLKEELAGKEYIDFDDFFDRVDKRTINKGYIEKLIKAGCFDFHVPNRHALLNHFYFNLRKDKEFLGTHEQFLAQKKKKKIKATDAFRLNPKDYDENTICKYEEELFGFYLTHHPYADLDYRNWDEVLDREPVDMGGKITEYKPHKTKNKGEDMCFLKVETAGGKIDVVVFPRTYAEYKTELFKGNIAIFSGKKQIENEQKQSLILDKVKKARKKKFQIEKPPELEELDKERKEKKKSGPTQQSLDLDAPPPKANPLGDLFEKQEKEEPDDLADLADMFT